MIRFKTVLLLSIICLLTLGGSQLLAGEPPPPGFEFGGKPVSATLVVIPVPDGSGTECNQAVILVYGTCKKIPFAFRSFNISATAFQALEQEDFFDVNGDPQIWELGVLMDCKAPASTIGWGITAFESWTKTSEYIIAEVFLQPLVRIGDK